MQAARDGRPSDAWREKDLSSIKESYHDLEIKVTNYSKELPKIEGQIDILGALANTIECRDYGLIPKTHSSMPNVGVHRNNLI
ncbi:ATP-dependent DNA helicase RecQ [Operophtera brumata]|uniref:ATP-dependent DNA helicase RecQ n=1 Tax=Operophtera brumata TaxID=104452 RepID=A0A0L7KVT6_OPEBR|nr:ATP-dependent DNA helicase RecQ [Operophtera brumata]